MQAEQRPRARCLNALRQLSAGLVARRHLHAGGAFAREQDCLNDAILSRGLTRGEYFSGKLVARAGGSVDDHGRAPARVFLGDPAGSTRPVEAGQVLSQARNTRIEAWEPEKVFTSTHGSSSVRK
jgi:hypothetical protein